MKLELRIEGETYAKIDVVRDDCGLTAQLIASTLAGVFDVAVVEAVA